VSGLDDLSLHPDVYEPAEDTQLLLDVLARDEPALAGARAIDVGTGTGAVARALAAAGARVVAVDINPHAAALARRNAPGADVLRGDLMRAVRGPFDVVAFNAPYLPSAEEERVEGWLDHAFHGGEGGVETTLRLVADLPRVLAPHGRAYVVVSSRADTAAIEEAARRAGLAVEKRGSVRFFFEEVAVWRFARL
jgi:release factor glutamine methyltransferase